MQSGCLVDKGRQAVTAAQDHGEAAPLRCLFSKQRNSGTQLGRSHEGFGTGGAPGVAQDNGEERGGIAKQREQGAPDRAENILGNMHTGPGCGAGLRRGTIGAYRLYRSNAG